MSRLARPLRLGSSLRALPPEQTLALGRGLMPVLGISRVTDITRLDRLGLPVFASVRPRGKTLRVHAGKGTRAVEAEAGALMEAVEFSAADPQRSNWSMQRMSVADLVAQFGHGLQLIDLAPQLGVRTTLRDVLPVVACQDIGRNRQVWLPAELVFLPYEPDEGPHVFGWSSNGLASGNTLEEATLHGLLEVLERDAVAMNLACDASSWVDPASLPAPFSGYATAWRSAGIELVVRHLPNAFGLPCFEAVLHEAQSDNVNLAGGYGLHLDRDVALARAVCEAAQSRLTCIHGGRDDLPDFYEKYAVLKAADRRTTEADLTRALSDSSRRVEYQALPATQGRSSSLSAILSDLLHSLAVLGFPAVFRHAFNLDLHGLHVVKVIVPRCECADHRTRRFGPRLFDRVVGQP